MGIPEAGNPVDLVWNLYPNAEENFKRTSKKHSVLRTNSRESSYVQVCMAQELSCLTLFLMDAAQVMSFI